MKPWERPDAADQIADPEGHDDGTGEAKSLYDQGVTKALETVILGIDNGMTLTQLRQAAVEMIERIS